MKASPLPCTSITLHPTYIDQARTLDVEDMPWLNASLLTIPLRQIPPRRLRSLDVLSRRRLGVKGGWPGLVVLGGAAAPMCPTSNTFSRAPSPSSCCQHASSGCPLLPRSLRPESAPYEAVSRRREPSTRVDNVACSEVSICNKSKWSNVSPAALR